MPEMSKLAQQTQDLIGAKDDTDRLFNRLRDLRLSDEDRQKAIDDYAEASTRYEKARAALGKGGGK